MSVKVLVADNQHVMRAGFKEMLGRADVEVVAEASSHREALRLIEKHKPRVVVLDVHFAGEDGFDTLHDIRRRWPKLAVVLWASDENPTYIARAVALGAQGYLSRGLGRKELVAALRNAASGRDAWTKEQREMFMHPPKPPADKTPLTSRELEVARFLAYGLPNKEIALAMGISVETIKEHVQHILQKLRVNERTSAAVWAIRQGVVDW